VSPVKYGLGFYIPEDDTLHLTGFVKLGGGRYIYPFHDKHGIIIYF
jgi:hypothetical protein